jgi:Tfp pilus assembly protein PilV
MESLTRTEWCSGRRSEAGESLIEVLIAVVIVGLTAAALLGALATTLTSSASHRSLANLDTAVKSYAETAKNQIELAPNPSYDPTVGCPGGGSYTVTSPPLPTNYTVTIQNVSDWNSAASPPTLDPLCTTPSSDIQVLHIVGTAPNGASQSLSVAVRNPN